MKIIKNLKNNRINTIILLVITIIILILLLKDNFDKTLETLSSMNIIFIVIAIFFFFLSIFFKAVANYITVNDKNKISLKEAFKHNVIVQFFNGITPFSTGGQPMEVYMLAQHNISAMEATNISIQNFIFYQTALVIYGILAVSYNYIFKIFSEATVLKRLVLLGFIINTLVVIILFLISFSRNIIKKISDSIIKILSKFKIMKDEDKSIKKIYSKLDEFHESAISLRKRKGLFVKGVLLNFISLTCLYIIPLYIVYSLGDYDSLNVIETLTSSAYVLLIGSFVPIPGASGGIEYGFLHFYGNFLQKNIIKAILIVWRFITYYLGIISGAIALNMEKKVK